MELDLVRVRHCSNSAAPFVFSSSDISLTSASNSFIAVPMPDYTNCAVVKLWVTGTSRKAIGKDNFYQRDRMCGDPESAFEDISER